MIKYFFFNKSSLSQEYPPHTVLAMLKVIEPRFHNIWLA